MADIDLRGLRRAVEEGVGAVRKIGGEVQRDSELVGDGSLLVVDAAADVWVVCVSVVMRHAGRRGAKENADTAFGSARLLFPSKFRRRLEPGMHTAAPQWAGDPRRVLTGDTPIRQQLTAANRCITL